MARVIDIDDPVDRRVADFRDLKSADRRQDLRGRKGLVIAEGVVSGCWSRSSRLVRCSGYRGRYDELAADLAEIDVPYYRASAEVMAEVVGFHHRAPIR